MKTLLPGDIVWLLNSALAGIYFIPWVSKSFKPTFISEILETGKIKQTNKELFRKLQKISSYDSKYATEYLFGELLWHFLLEAHIGEMASKLIKIKISETESGCLLIA